MPMQRPSGTRTGAQARERLTRIPPVQRESTVDLIAARLRTAIFAGTLPVGSHLGEVELSEQLGVSRGPLREAAQRLVSERLLVARRRGLAVPVLDTEDVADVYLLRAAIETAACRRLFHTEMFGAQGGAQDARAKAIKALRKCHHKMTRAAARSDARALGDADIAFHRTLVDAAGSPRLSRLIEALLIETRLCTYSLEHEFRVRDDLPDAHLTLIEALESGDETVAVRAVEQHLEHAATRLESGPDDAGTIAAPAHTTPVPLDPLELPSL